MGGFVAAPPRRAGPCARTSSSSSRDRCLLAGGVGDGGDDAAVGVEEVSLASLGDDHDAVGETLARSIAEWLDAEWMPQEVHAQMGESARDSYVACRASGKDEVAEIMTRVTDDLYEKWSEYNADAFVNAWDIGNYVADYLIAKSGSETCGCSTPIK